MKNILSFKFIIVFTQIIPHVFVYSGTEYTIRSRKTPPKKVHHQTTTETCKDHGNGEKICTFTAVDTNDDDENYVTYNVRFGGGMFFNQYTAYDPISKKFVYITWKRESEEELGGDIPKDPPKPVGAYYDHNTGKTINLYQFPNVDHPLPIIPSLDEMKFCPFTGDQNYESSPTIAYD